jgi:hypothetical protein
MKRLNNILCSTLFLLSCGNTPKQKQEKIYVDNDILGKWLLVVNQVNYPSLIFKNDSTAIFNSMGDTIYRYKYHIEKTELILKDINGKETKDKILKLDKDSLIFETLIEHKIIQRYTRKK